MILNQPHAQEQGHFSVKLDLEIETKADEVRSRTLEFERCDWLFVNAFNSITTTFGFARGLHSSSYRLTLPCICYFNGPQNFPSSGLVRSHAVRFPSTHMKMQVHVVVLIGHGDTPYRPPPPTQWRGIIAGWSMLAMSARLNHGMCG
jgi:hypothetical protein